MNLDGIRSMKLTQLQPRYVLIIPSSDDAYAEMVKEMNQEDAEIGWAEYQEFKQVNRENPGYFDMVIPADTVEQAHIAVRDLVKDFLGKELKIIFFFKKFLDFFLLCFTNIGGFIID